MRVLLIAAAAALVATSALAQSAVVSDLQLSNDADGFQTFRVRAGGYLRYDSPFQFAGVVAQTSAYDHRDWSENATGVLATWRRQRRDTLAGSAGEAGLVRVGGRTRAVGDATWTFRPRPRTGFELIAAADVVETAPALEQGISYLFAGASAEQQFGERLTAVGLVGHQRFTDDNDRLHLRGRLIWLLVPEHGVTAQVRFRRFDGDEIVRPAAYFNPAEYDEWQAALTIRKRHAGWQWYGVAGAGTESVDGTDRKGTALVEFRAEGPIRGETRLIVRGGYSRAAGFGNVDGYWYRSVGVTVVVPVGR